MRKHNSLQRWEIINNRKKFYCTGPRTKAPRLSLLKNRAENKSKSFKIVFGLNFVRAKAKNIKDIAQYCRKLGQKSFIGPVANIIKLNGRKLLFS